MSLNSDNGHTNRKTLVTGGAGFIGSHLVERLLSVGNQVVILDNFNDFYDPAFKRTNIERLLSGGNGSSLRVVEGDIRDANLVNDLFETNEFEEVFHLAAMAGVRPSLKNPKLYFDVNVQGTITLLDAAVAFGKPEIIFASSSSVYGGSPDVPFTENDPVNQPVSPYAASKKSAELICHTYSHLHGLNTVCLRFFTVYGPRQRPEMAIHRFTRRIIDGQPVPMYGDGTTSRDYTFIDDIIDGTMAAARECKGFSIYNLGNNHPISLRDLIQAIGETLGIDPVIEEHPLPPGDVIQTWADISKAETNLNYRPKVNLDDGLAEFAKWYRTTFGNNS